MTDAIIASIIGGAFGMSIKAIDVFVDYTKRKEAKNNVFEEQRVKFMEALIDRLEKVNKERDEAENEAEEYKEKFWHEYEERLKRLESRKRTNEQRNN